MKKSTNIRLKMLMLLILSSYLLNFRRKWGFSSWTCTVRLSQAGQSSGKDRFYAWRTSPKLVRSLASTMKKDVLSLKDKGCKFGWKTDLLILMERTISRQTINNRLKISKSLLQLVTTHKPSKNCSETNLTDSMWAISTTLKAFWLERRQRWSFTGVYWWTKPRWVFNFLKTQRSELL